MILYTTLLSLACHLTSDMRRFYLSHVNELSSLCNKVNKPQTSLLLWLLCGGKMVMGG